MKLLFTPLSILGGLAAGAVGKKIFDLVWGLVDDEEAPEPKHRELPLGKLVLALVVQGAIFRLVRGMADHGMRHGYARLTGSWPGEEEPDKE
ncbi:MAG: hypothetical protein QOC77_3484 [Thermoleophilaceae bacterium]|nr:hypothetical protein [Thermoleophilaceae bacterium]MEA2469059.1 hypothetical protein [Thermoleophilaceae bacterium]